MKKQIFISIFIYFFLFLVLFISFYGFLYREGEMLLPMLIFGGAYLILSLPFYFFIVKERLKVDENVLHLTKEILHEIAIPISTIQANSSLLKRTLKEDEKSLKRLGRIVDSSKRLERLYDELLYSIKKEIKTVEREEVELKELIEERVKTMKMFNRNDFSLSLEEHRLKIDKIGFEKMLDNLLTNAMKYSSKESTITIRLKNAILSIEDQGIGMDEMELLNIYERYFQLDGQRAGEGIGLALVKAYCDNENIKIHIFSKKGEGTKVTLDLTLI